MNRRLYFVLAVSVLLILRVGSDCASAASVDHQDMKCCHSMPCTPSNSQGCCKEMVSAQTINMLPAQHVSVDGPVVATVEYPRLTDILRHLPEPYLVVDAQQHSPPKLYTLHASLLI